MKYQHNYKMKKLVLEIYPDAVLVEHYEIGKRKPKFYVNLNPELVGYECSMSSTKTGAWERAYTHILHPDFVDYFRKEFSTMEDFRDKVQEVLDNMTPEDRNRIDVYLDCLELSSKKIPIYKGCLNETCFCTGACREIIGYRDKLPGEK